MNNTRDHQKLCDDLLFEVGSRPDARLFPRRVGLAIPIGTTRPVYYGVKGEADLQGFVMIAGYPVTLMVEVKTGLAKLTKEQMAFRDMCLRFKVIYIIARSKDQALQDLEDAIKSYSRKPQ